MSSILVVLIGTVLVNAFLLMHHDEALGGDRDRGGGANAIRIGSASSVTVFLATALTLSLWQLLLGAPAEIALFIYAFSIVSIVIGLHRLTRRRLPRLRRSLASSPLLIVSNGLALGAILFDAVNSIEPLLLLAYSAALGGSFVVMLVVFVTLAARIIDREVPKVFRVAPITLVSAGLLALALMGFTGLVRV